METETKPLKLNLGSGKKPLEGYINIDIRDVPGTDIVADISTLESFEDSSVDEVFACDSLEHLGRKVCYDALRDWIRVLKPGGVLKIRVPETIKLFRDYESKIEKAENIEKEREIFFRFIQLLFGDQSIPENTHLNGFRTDLLVKDIENMGMRVVREDIHYDGSTNLRLTAIKGNKEPLVSLTHPV